MLLQGHLILLLYRDHQSPQTRAKMSSVVKEIIGDPRKCKLESAEQNAVGEYVGGVHFERHDRAVPLKGTKRAYTLGPSHERVPKTSAPHAQAKMFHGEWDEHLKLQRDIIEVFAQ
jgi:hypothetical protein